MLPLLLMLLSDPLATGATVPEPDPEVRLRTLDGLTVEPCANLGYQRIERPGGQPDLLQNDLTYTPTNEVRHYLLLDRRVRGCPAPISYSLPGRQDGFIRELGRFTPPVRIQPPRSSE